MARLLALPAVLALLLAASPARPADSVPTTPPAPAADAAAAAASPGDPAALASRCDPELERLLKTDPAQAAARASQMEQEYRSNPYCLAAVGTAFLLNGNAFFAIESLLAAEQMLATACEERTGGAEPGCDRDALARVNLLLCVALVKSSQWEDAHVRCAAESPSPDLAAAYDYFGGVAAFRAGAQKDAVTRLERLEDQALASPFADSAARFRDLAWGALIGVTPGVRLGVGTGAMYDTNALMAPDDPTLAGLKPEDVPSWKAAAWASLAWLPRNWGRYQINTRLNVSRSQAFASPADSLDTSDAQASAALARYDTWVSDKGAWQAKYAYRVTFMDGGEATLEKEPFAFSESHTVALSRTFFDAAGRSYSVQYSPAYQRYIEQVRNGVSHSLAVGADLPYADVLRLGVGLSGSWVDASAAYSRRGIGLGLTLLLALPGDWGISAGATAQMDDYYDSLGYFSTADRRADRLYLSRLEVYWNVGAGFALGLYGSASGRMSNLDFLSYDKQEGGLTVNWSFQEGL